MSNYKFKYMGEPLNIDDLSAYSGKSIEEIKEICKGKNIIEVSNLKDIKVIEIKETIKPVMIDLSRLKSNKEKKEKELLKIKAERVRKKLTKHIINVLEKTNDNITRKRKVFEINGKEITIEKLSKKLGYKTGYLKQKLARATKVMIGKNIIDISYVDYLSNRVIKYIYDGNKLKLNTPLSEVKKESRYVHEINSFLKRKNYTVSLGVIYSNIHPDKIINKLEYLALNNEKYWFGSLNQIIQKTKSSSKVAKIRSQIKRNKYYEENGVVYTKGKYLKELRK